MSIKDFNITPGLPFALQLVGGPLRSGASWGTGGGGSGNLTPAVTLLGHGVAPAFARFSITNLASAGFQYPSVPAGSVVWNKYLHDLIIRWTVTETAYTYDKLSNIRPSWNDPQIMWGPEPCYCFLEDGGSHDVRVDVWDMFGGHDFGEVTVNLRAASEDYDDSNTYVCSPSSTWTGAPAHDPANRTTTFDDLLDAMEAHTGSAKVWGYMSGGEEFTVVDRGNFLSNWKNLYLSNHPGFGAGRPILNYSDQTTLFRVKPVDFTGENMAVFRGLDARGPWDGATETGLADRDRPSFMQTFGGNIVVTDCLIDGMANGQSISGSLDMLTMFHNSSITNFFNYGIYHSGGTDGFLGVLGVKIAHKTDNYSGGGGDDNEGQQHSCVRIQSIDKYYGDVVELFTTASNDRQAAGGLATPPHAAAWRDHRNKLPSSGIVPTGFLGRVCIEGGTNMLSSGPAASATNRPTNLLIDMAEWIPAGALSEPLGGGPGTTIRNFSVCIPKCDSLLEGFMAFLARGVRQYFKATGASSFVAGEVVTHENGNSATISRVAGTDIYLESDVNGEFDVGGNVTGNIAGSGTVTRSLENDYQNYLEPFEVYQGTLVTLRERPVAPALTEDTDNDERHLPATTRDIVRHAPNTDIPYNAEGPFVETLKEWFRPKSQGSKWQNWDGNMNPVEQLTMTYETGIAAYRLGYDNGTVDFSQREQVTGEDSEAVGFIQRIEGTTASGNVFLIAVDGEFINDEVLIGSEAGAAVVNGTLQEEGAYDFIPDTGSSASGTGTAFGGGTRASRFDIDMNVRHATAPNKGAFDPA